MLRRVLIVVVVIALIAAGVLFVLYGNRRFFGHDTFTPTTSTVPTTPGSTAPDYVLPTPTPPPNGASLPTSTTFVIQGRSGGVLVRNFYTDALDVGAFGTTIGGGVDYTITYVRSTGTFMIFLQPFIRERVAGARADAEALLLQRLGLVDRKQDACKLNIIMSVDATLQERLNLRLPDNLGLSFCPTISVIEGGATR